MRRGILLFAILLQAACSNTDPPSPSSSAEVVLGGSAGRARVFAEVADSDAERTEGLMWRTSLGPDAGMVFLWDEPVTTTFSMKNTTIPLAIAFWEQDGTIVTIREMIPCSADACETYGADAPFVGALEVNAGYFTEHGIGVGDRATVLRDDG